MKGTYWMLLTIGLLGALPTTATADVPDFVAYSGRLTDGAAWGQSTQVDLTFRIYDCGCEPGGQCDEPCNQWPGTPLHEQSFAAAPVEDGYFSVILTGVADIFGAHAQTWIAVCVGAECTQVDDLLPRLAVGSVPYAIVSTKARHVELTSGSERISVNAIFRDGTSNKQGIAGVGSFDGMGKTNGKFLFEYPQGSGVVLAGYRAGKKACEVALDSPTAHMCTSQEMVLSAQMGVSPDEWMWVSTGNREVYTNSMGMTANVRDCHSWTMDQHAEGDVALLGRYWKQGVPSHTYCSNAHPIACCD